MIRIEATYELATPLFLAGADSGQVEFRVPSFKGALRFWWRACAGWARGNVDTLRQTEAALFGSADSKVGQSRLHITCDAPVSGKNLAGPRTCLHQDERTRTPGLRSAHGTGYLGYGVMKADRGELSRACILPPWQFCVRMRLRPPRAGADEQEVERLVRALQALGLLGGLGSKSRKGYGSLVLRELTVGGQPRWTPPVGAHELEARIRDLYAEVPRGRDAEPEWSALSGHSRHLLLVPKRGEKNAPASGLEALDRVGRELVRYRSFGKNGRILDGEEAKPRFRRDHDIAKGKVRDQHPARVAFGLPHNYFGRELGVQPGLDEPPRRDRPPRREAPTQRDALTRRASPLFIHIHLCEGVPVPVLSFLPARFLPAGHDRVRMRWRDDSRVVPLTATPALWQPILGFLDRWKDPASRKEAAFVAHEVKHHE